MELNKFIKNGIKNGDFKIYDSYDYYYRVARLLRYHYIGTWGNHFFVSEKEQPQWNNRLWNGDRPDFIIPKTTKQTIKDNFFYTLKRDNIPHIKPHR